MKYFLLICALTSTISAASFSSEKPVGRVVTLTDSWYIQSLEKIDAVGNVISSQSFGMHDWYRSTVPSTVVGSLVADGVFKNPFQGRNLDNIPDSLFDKPWWYRTTFVLPGKTRSISHATLKFLGINYRADILAQRKVDCKQ